MERNWEEERKRKLYSCYIVRERNLCLTEGRSNSHYDVTRFIYNAPGFPRYSLDAVCTIFVFTSHSLVHGSSQC